MGCADERLDMNEHAGGMEKNQCISQHVTDTVIAYRMKENSSHSLMMLMSKITSGTLHLRSVEKSCP